jgi:outer membrane protein TolC
MKPLLILALAASLAGSAIAQQPDKHLPVSPTVAELDAALEGKTLTIEDAVRIALITNRSYATAAANLDRAKGRVGEARAALKPTAGISGKLDYYDRPTTADFGGSSIAIVNQFSDVYNANITLPIDISGAIHSAVDQAKFNEVAARIDVNRVRNQLVFEVRNAFFEALRAQGRLVVSEDSLANAHTRLEDAQAMLRAGTGTQFDVLTSQRDVADAEQVMIKARGDVTIALARLKNAIGIDVSDSIQITDEGAVQEPSAKDVPTTPSTIPDDQLHIAKNLVPLGPDYQSFVAEGLSNRPEILEQDAAITAAQRGVRYESRSLLPSLSLSAGYVYQPNHAGFTPEKQGVLTLGFSVPILDGGLAKARRQEAEAMVEASKIDHRTAVDLVTLEVQEAYVELSQAAERVQVATVGLEQAREAFRLARLRAQVGVSASPQVSPQLELSNAQTTLTQAETNRVDAIYDYNLARAALDRATGRYSYGPGAGFHERPSAATTGQPEK